MKHLRLILASILMMTLSQPALAQDKGVAMEYRIKAVVLFNFAKYIKWPDRAFHSRNQPIRVCIMGDSPFGSVFSSGDAPTEAQGRELKVTSVSSSSSKADISGCQILFWQRKEQSAIRRIKPNFEEHGILTIGNEKSDEAIIWFKKIKGKVRFAIRHKKAESLGFKIHSQLLKLAVLED